MFTHCFESICVFTTNRTTSEDQNKLDVRVKLAHESYNGATQHAIDQGLPQAAARQVGPVQYLVLLRWAQHRLS